MSTDRQEFLQPRLVGERFAGHAIPLEVLADLAALQEMVIEVAKWKYKEAHQGRQRVPRGFSEGVSLKLKDVMDGSAIPLILLDMPQESHAELFSRSDVFEEARDAIISAIHAAERNLDISKYLPERFLSYFKRLGRSLQDGERIEFVISDEPGEVAIFTKSVRRQLLMASSSFDFVEEAVAIRGRVFEANKNVMTFVLLTDDGLHVDAPLEGKYREAILEAFNGFETGLKIEFRGVGRFNRQNNLQRVIEINELSVLDPLDVSARLQEFRSLQPGWLDGYGHPPSSEGLDWLQAAFDQHYPDEVDLPFLYPTEEGHVRAEWSINGHEVSLEINLSNHVGQWHVTHLQARSDDARELDLNSPAGWSDLVHLLKSLRGDVI